MRTKFLLPALVGLSLVACTNEDDFSQNAELKQSPVTFTVEKDGVDFGSRADINGTAVKFGMGDLLSLYHNSALPSDYLTDSTIKAGQNAIFEGENEAGEGELVFKTKSMILAGKAVMVYPADTSFVNTVGSAIKISVPATQDAETKLFQPYMSEAFAISEYDGVKAPDNSAGYGRNYVLPLKKVGSLVQMRLIPENINLVNDLEDVADIAFSSVEMEAEGGKFAATVKVAAKNETPKLATANAVTNSDVEKFAHLEKVTVVETDPAYNVSTISTTDIAEGIAYFTLLPQTAPQALTSATITVNTNYGYVEVVSVLDSEFDEEKPVTYPLIGQTASAPKMTLADAVETMINTAWGENRESSNFKGEYTGASFKRNFTFNLRNLKMDGLTITSSDHLIDVLSVYEALELGDENITFNLDAEGEKFLLTSAALDKLADVNTVNEIKLTSVDAILLTENNLDKYNNEHVIFTSVPNVYLDATWSLAQNADLSKMASLTTEATAALTITEAANLAVGTEPKDVPFADEIKFTNNGTLIVGGAIYVEGMTSNGSISIAEGRKLYTVGGAGFYGEVVNNGEITSYSGNIRNLAVIDNYGKIASLKANSAQIRNGGVINVKSEDALTYISYNVVKDGSTYYMGVINLMNRNDEVKIESESSAVPAGYKSGYIKYTIDAADDMVFESLESDKFNFLTVNVNKNLAKIDLSAMENVSFLKITGTEANVIRKETALTLIDLIIDSGMRYLSANEALSVDHIYVKTGKSLVHAGNVTGTQNDTYNSGNYDEVDDATYKGEIETTM